MSDLTIRAQIYRFFAEHCRAPLASEIATQTGQAEVDIRQALARLQDRHMICLDAGSGEIRMANPFSAVPTNYRVIAGHKAWWANCAWDTLGIAAALKIDVTIEAAHPLDGQTVRMAVVGGEVTHRDLLIYFPLPCRQWYDDLVFT